VPEEAAPAGAAAVGVTLVGFEDGAGVPLLEMPLSDPLMLSRSSAGRERAVDLAADSEAAESPLPRWPPLGLTSWPSLLS